jgi:hypothetical protein
MIIYCCDNYKSGSALNLTSKFNPASKLNPAYKLNPVSLLNSESVQGPETSPVNQRGLKTSSDSLCLLRRCVGDYASRNGTDIPEAEIAAAIPERPPYGKPFFASWPGIEFSISHSGHFWCCAVSSEPVGLDIEDMSRKITPQRCLSIAARFFCPDEEAYIAAALSNSADPSGIIPRFFKIWVMKEAYLKYHGLGLSAGLNSFSVLAGSPPENLPNSLPNNLPESLAKSLPESFPESLPNNLPEDSRELRFTFPSITPGLICACYSAAPDGSV